MKKKGIKLTACVSVLAMALSGCGSNVSSRAIDEGSNGAVDANASTYNITAEVNTVYSAQKLGELASFGDGYKFEFDGSENDIKFSSLGKSSVGIKAIKDGQDSKTLVLNVNVVDTTSPVFSGIKDITIKAGESVDLKSGVTVSDNYDQNVEFTVTYDKDDTNTGAPGKHVITYVAKDSSGNVASRKATLTIEGDSSQSDQTTTTTTTAQTEAPKTESSSVSATAAAPDPNAKSDNVKFYQDRIVIAGDSIAYGFCAYGYVPYEHNIAKGSTAMRNYDDTSLFMFDPTGSDLSMMDAIKAVKPSLLYISMGMNDVNLIDSDTYVSRYKEFIQKAKEQVPDAIIVAASITPISSTCGFTDINNIKSCNEGLKNLIGSLNDPNVLFFDAYSVIVGSDGSYSAPNTTGPDGIHLVGSCYQQILEKLAVVLDQSGIKDKITEIESKR